MNDYPTDRQGCHYAIQFMKWLFNSGAANEIGPDATALLCAVVTQEDEFLNLRAPNFFNEQLMNRCGMRSEHAFIRARQIAIDASLLEYSEGKKRSPGRYFVRGFTAQNAVEPGRKQRESKTQSSPSNPNPNPNPNSFALWWSIYVRKTAKGAAERAYPNAVSEIHLTDRVPMEEAEKLLIEWTRQRMPILAETEPTFRPYPATWLNAKCYRDEMTVSPARVSKQHPLAQKVAS